MRPSIRTDVRGRAASEAKEPFKLKKFANASPKIVQADVRCNAAHHVATHRATCNALRHVAAQHSTLQHVATWYSMLQHSIHDTTQYSTVQQSTARSNATQHGAAACTLSYCNMVHCCSTVWSVWFRLHPPDSLPVADAWGLDHCATDSSVQIIRTAAKLTRQCVQLFGFDVPSAAPCGRLHVCSSARVHIKKVRPCDGPECLYGEIGSSESAARHGEREFN